MRGAATEVLDDFRRSVRLDEDATEAFESMRCCAKAGLRF
jgi:hypothetical protein